MRSRAARILLFSLLALIGDVQARAGQLPEVDLARTGILDDISENTVVYFSPSGNLPKDSLMSIGWSVPGTPKYPHFIAPRRVNMTALLKFALFNSSDSVQGVYFCPGYLFSSIRIFRLGDSGRSITELPPVLPRDSDSLGYRKITLRPHEHAVFIAILTFVKASTNSLNPTLTRESYITQAISLIHTNKTHNDIISNLFAGIMLMMIFYALSEYAQTGKPEFLYYAVYAICIGSLLILKSILHNKATTFNYLFEGWLDNIIFCIGYIFYIIFHRKFLETEKNYPALDRILFWGSNTIIVMTALYGLAVLTVSDFQVRNYIENATKYLLLLISILFIGKGLRYKDVLMNYIVYGNISLCLLSIISQAMIATNFKPVNGTSILNQALFYYQAGIIVELLFFLFALTYKNKKEIIRSIQKEEKLKLETERKELEKQVAVLAAKQDERNRISADMHDELGSGVTAIRLMSEIVKTKMKEQTLPEIDKISHSANELLNKMNTIIWTMTSSNDSVENLIAYIRSYAVEFFENTAIDCYFNMPIAIPSREISGEKRRNIFLSVKEALNNVLKHSQGSVVKINVTVGDRLVIEILDDGVGINMDRLRKFGNGLNNMKRRMASIDGEFNIENHEGTRTRFLLAL
jgi:signal transduction histidine kinase